MATSQHRVADAIGRREFVRTSACVLGAVTLAGVTGCGSREMEAVETPSFRFGQEAEMSKRVLVGYATNKGSTVGVAKAVGKALSDRGFTVDVISLASNPSPEGYDAAVLGSAINGGAWLPFASRYVEANADALGAIPCAAFCVHGMNAGTDEKQTAKRRAYLASVRSKIALTDEGYFLGKLDDMNAIALLAFKAFGGAGEGDLRDYDAIGSWADKLQV